MWLTILTMLFSLFGCSFVTLVFGLLKAGKRADEAEERILAIISPTPRRVMKVAVDAQTRNPYLPTYVPKSL